MLIVPAFALLAGCELIAGVRDITVSEGSGDGSEGDSPSSNFDALGDMFVGDDAGYDAPGSTGGDGAQSDTTTAGPEGGGGADVAPGAEAAQADATGVKLDASSTDAPAADAPMADAPTADAPAADAPAADAAGSMYVLIDDMEGNTGEISAPTAGNGYWFTYGDGTVGGTLVPAAGAAFTDSMISPTRAVSAPFAALSGASSTYAAQVSGSGFATYAGMGFNLKNPRAAYNASAYVGFVFWGRLGGTATDGTVRFLVPDKNTDPSGGVCTTKCSDFLGENLVFTASWQQFTIMYTDLAQVGFGSPVETTLDAANVYAVEFQVSTKAPAGGAFDIWVDDIYFIKP